MTLSHAPLKQWLPAQVSMTVWNMFVGVFDAFVGKFDIVHVRLVFPTNDAAPVIQHLARMLKPGGYLQCDERAASTTVS